MKTEIIAPVTCNTCQAIVDEAEATITFGTPDTYTCETCWEVA